MADKPIPDPREIKGSGLTRVICPKCGHKTDTWLAWGDVSVECEKCNKWFDVVMPRPKEKPFVRN